MTDPYKVISFLNFAGHSDPSLAFEMGGAVFIGTLAFCYAKHRNKTLFGKTLHLPTNHKIDFHLILGSLTFVIGWGMAGYCPGPDIATVTQGGKPLIFVLSMVFGMEFNETLSQFHLRHR